MVVKVQHEGVDPLMRRDMVAARRIAKLIAWIDRRFATFHTVMQAWEGEMCVEHGTAHEMYKELDFRVEAANLEEVEINLRRAAMLRPVVPDGPCLADFKITDEEVMLSRQFCACLRNSAQF